MTKHIETWRERLKYGHSMQWAMMAEIGDLRAALAAVPEGWKLVPMVPTDEMDAAGREVTARALFRCSTIWEAMIAAAPAKPQEQPVAAQQDEPTDEQICEALRAHGVRTHGVYSDESQFILGVTKSTIAAFRSLYSAHPAQAPQQEAGQAQEPCACWPGRMCNKVEKCAGQSAPAVQEQPVAAQQDASKMRAALYAIAHTLDDHELRAAAKEAYEAAHPAQAPQQEAGQARDDCANCGGKWRIDVAGACACGDYRPVSLASAPAQPKLSTCRHCGFRVALNEAPQEEAPAQPTVPEGYVRYCAHCGSIGEVDAKYRDCCPDGGSARHVPKEVAEQAKMGFKQIISKALTDAAEAGSGGQR